jgi:hypothetical protein
VHSGSDMSLAAAGVDPRMTKRLKSHQLASKQNDVAVRMDSMRWGAAAVCDSGLCRLTALVEVPVHCGSWNAWLMWAGAGL